MSVLVADSSFFFFLFLVCFTYFFQSKLQEQNCICCSKGKPGNSALCLGSLHPAKVRLGSKIDCPTLFQHLAVRELLAVADNSVRGVRHHLAALSFSAGVGGNLVAVQASRISTYLHMSGMPGESSETAPRKCPSPCSTFFGSGTCDGCGNLLTPASSRCRRGLAAVWPGSGRACQ